MQIFKIFEIICWCIFCFCFANTLYIGYKISKEAKEQEQFLRDLHFSEVEAYNRDVKKWGFKPERRGMKAPTSYRLNLPVKESKGGDVHVGFSNSINSDNN